MGGKGLLTSPNRWLTTFTAARHIWKVIEEIIQLMDVCVNFWIEQRIESCHKIRCSLLHLNLESVGRKSRTLLILAPGEKTWQPAWWGLSLCPVHSGTGSSFMTLSGITRVEKTEEGMSAPMCSASTLQLSGRLTAWTLNRNHIQPFGGFMRGPRRQGTVMRLII